MEEKIIVIINILFGINLLLLYKVRFLETGEKANHYLYLALFLFLISVWKLGGML